MVFSLFWRRLGLQNHPQHKPDSTWNGKRRSFFLCVLVSCASAVLWGLGCVLGRKIHSKSTPKRLILGAFWGSGRLLDGLWLPSASWTALGAAFGWLWGGSWPVLGASWGALWGVLGASGRPRSPPRGPKRPPRGLQEAPKRPQETAKRPRRAFWGFIGAKAENAYFSNGKTGIFRGPGGLCGPLGGLLGPLGSLLGASWGHLGSFLGRRGASWGVWAHLGASWGGR